MIEPQKRPVEFWCNNCTKQVYDNARKKRYCQELATLITQAIWCTTWRCGCIWHSSANTSDKVLLGEFYKSLFEGGAFSVGSVLTARRIYDEMCQQKEREQ